jgi:CRP-like cAMP-binding protein
VATKKEKVANCANVPLFSDLSQKELARLVDRSKDTTHHEGESVVTEGKGGVGFHMILEGTAKVVRAGRKVADLGPGEFFGEMTLIDGAPRSASVIATSELQTMVLTSWEFKPLVKSYPEMAWKLMTYLTGRVREEQSARDAAIS